MTAASEAFLSGGPLDGRTHMVDGPLLEISADGLIYRYVKTTRQRDDRAVFQYDGTISPDGGLPGAGAGAPQDRIASPLANQSRQE
jgi:hypothetical protein